MPFPDIDPVLIQLGPLAIRWYALAYVAGFLLGWLYIRRQRGAILTEAQLESLFTWAVLGVILGGRTGYVLFYNLPFYLEHPLDIPAVWKGGMSFHGGMAGLLLGVWLFCRRQKLAFLAVMDLMAIAAPIGLFFGRIANFINGELFGRAADVPWAVIFPHGGPLPRHPSQLYEALGEGLILFFVLFFASRTAWFKAVPGRLGGLFLSGYALARIVVECFREPDPQLGFLFAGATMGQLLSLPMLAIGLWLIFRRK